MTRIMPQTMQKKSLLPNGFHDILPHEALMYHETNIHMLSLFEHYGYDLVIPPMIEFEDSLFTHSGKAVRHQTFRLMDPVSQKMMGLRADMTVQIARIASTRLVNEALPLRLAYSGQVFCVKGTDVHAERQAIQTGIEIIGVDSAQADAESVIIALDALIQLGIQNLSIDFNIPQLATMLLEGLNLDPRKTMRLKEALNRKDIATLQTIDSTIGELLIKLAIPHGEAEQALAYLFSLPLPDKAKKLCIHLEHVIKHVVDSGLDVHISVDPLEQRGFEYHTNIGFTIFAKDYTGELGRGGHYLIDSAEGTIPASGVTLYVNDICRLLPEPKRKPYILVPESTTLETTKTLHSKGFCTIYSSENIENMESEAKRLKCNAIYRDGRIEELG